MVKKAGNELMSDAKKRWETLGKAENYYLKKMQDGTFISNR